MTDDAPADGATSLKWRAMALYGVLFTLGGVALVAWDAKVQSGDVNDIFDVIGVVMCVSGALVVVAGWHASRRGPSVWLLAAVFFLHVGPAFTFGIYAIIFWGVT